MKLDKRHWAFGTFKDAEKAEAQELSKLSYQKRARTITYLRECFYGRKATTGRVQRVYQVSKQK
jgi:hypothetical protein